MVFLLTSLQIQIETTQVTISMREPPSFRILYTLCLLYLSIDPVLEYWLSLQIPSFALSSLCFLLSSWILSIARRTKDEKSRKPQLNTLHTLCLIPYHIFYISFTHFSKLSLPHWIGHSFSWLSLQMGFSHLFREDWDYVICISFSLPPNNCVLIECFHVHHSPALPNSM